MGMRLAFVAFLVSMTLNALFLLYRLDWFVIPAALTGWYLADMASGAIHMVMDYQPCRAGVGLDRLYFYAGSRESADYIELRKAVMLRINPYERIVFDFKTHHPRPMALGRRSLLNQIGPTLLTASLPLTVFLSAVNALTALPGWINAGALTLLLGATFAQYFHGSLHRPDVPNFVMAMRRFKLLMSPAAHQLHHDSLQRDFATNCGWSNGLLNPLFRSLHEQGLLRDSGLEPTMEAAGLSFPATGSPRVASH